MKGAAKYNLLLILCFLFLAFDVSPQTIARRPSMPSHKKFEMYKSVVEYGAKLDGITDDSQAIQQSLNEQNYAYIPYSEAGIRVDETVIITDGQKVEGALRSVKIISGVAPGEFTFLIKDVPFLGSAYLSNFTMHFLNKGSNGIRILESRQAHILDFTIVANDKCDIGVLIQAVKKGSAWNTIDRYVIIKAAVAAIKLESSTEKPWVNRNYIGYGIAQTCEIGLWIRRGGTNTSLLNCQNCGIGIFLDEQSNSNRIDTFTESTDIPIKIVKGSRNNFISGNFSVKDSQDRGTNTIWNLPVPKMKQLSKKN